MLIIQFVLCNCTKSVINNQSINVIALVKVQIDSTVIQEKRQHVWKCVNFSSWQLFNGTITPSNFTDTPIVENFGCIKDATTSATTTTTTAATTTTIIVQTLTFVWTSKQPNTESHYSTFVNTYAETIAFRIWDSL